MPRRASDLNTYGTMAASQSIDQIDRVSSDCDLMQAYDETNPINAIKKQLLYRSDTLINYESAQYHHHHHHQSSDEASHASSARLVISQTCCNTSYIIEPVAFIQNLASSIMNFSLSLFIYNRILQRIIDQNQSHNTTNTTNFSLSFSPQNFHFSPTLMDTMVVRDADNCIHEHKNVSHALMYATQSMFG